MTRLLSALRRQLNVNEEKAAALVWVAGALVTLLAASAFAVDLGWIYLQSSRLQAAADAAALAGVVNLPGFPAQATLDAQEAAGANGYPVPAVATLDDTVLADNKYQVALTTQVPTFFLKVIGIDQISISQDAIGQYVKPVRLGSPSNTFGGPGNNFWAAINGQYTEKEQGDPFATRCNKQANADTPACSGKLNPEFRELGYYYGVEVAPGSSGLSLQFYDGGHYGRQDDGCGWVTGTSGPDDWVWKRCWGGVAMQYRLYAPDATPTDPTDNSNLLCSNTFPVYFNSPTKKDKNQGHFERWDGPRNCRIDGSLTPGIYVLQLPAPRYEGSTIFGIRAQVDSGPQPKVYGILDMSIYVNFAGDHAEPYLAEVRPEHAGKTLEIDIYDLGDVDGKAEIYFLTPGDSIPDCVWHSTNGESDNSLGTCRIDISDQRFNADWLYVEIPIPDTYNCDPDTPTGCWWKIHIFSDGQAHDRTTWAARISGDPVRLVE